MQTLRLNSKGADVEALQIALVHYYKGERNIPISGVFTDIMLPLLLDFQKAYGLEADGICGQLTWGILKEQTKYKFMVSIHGGHGGINPQTGEYTTLPSTGKRYQHKGNELHTKDGWFYEGHENRIAANEVAAQLRTLGIFVLVTHHPYNCDYGKLSTHINQTAPYIRAGYIGYTHAFHSNAIGTDAGETKLNGTRGGYVFSTKGHTISDSLSTKLISLWKEQFGSWVRSTMEENFQVIRDAEKYALEAHAPQWGAILEEFGFFTSLPDCKFIIGSRAQRVKCAVQLALWAKEQFLKKIV